MKPGLRSLSLTLLALPLAACVSLLPRSEPAQLYRFEIADPAPSVGNGSRATVLKMTTGFQRAAAGDGILTTGAGGEAAYIAGARWVSPASVMFDEQLEKAFHGAGRLRLVGRGEMARADYVLRVEVSRFEARYDKGPRGAPLVVVEVRAVLTSQADRKVLDDRLFTASVRAADNRVSAIVPAYDAAVTTTLGDLVAWADATAR